MTRKPDTLGEAVHGETPDYAGVGARKTPGPVLERMRDLAKDLAGRGWHLRTGGARGADDAFARAVPAGRRTVFIPWRGYSGWDDSEAHALTTGELEALREAAAAHHPAWQRCAARVRDLHARNVAILMGADMREPVNAMVCWTDSGRIQGGTGMAIRLARHYRIPVLNLATLDVREAMDRLDGIAQSHESRDMAQERALADRASERPSSQAVPHPGRDKRDKDWWLADGQRQAPAARRWPGSRGSARSASAPAPAAGGRRAAEGTGSFR